MPSKHCENFSMYDWKTRLTDSQDLTWDSSMKILETVHIGKHMKAGPPSNDVGNEGLFIGIPGYLENVGRHPGSHEVLTCWMSSIS